MKKINAVMFSFAVIVFLGCGDGGLNCAGDCNTPAPASQIEDDAAPNTLE